MPPNPSMRMDPWKFYDITHRDHIFCNPLSAAKFEDLIDVLHLTPGNRVLDIACGKAELLIRLVERYAVSAVGVDISPYCIRDARAKAVGRVPQAGISFVEMDAAHYQAGEDLFDLAMCVGASWIWHGHRDTLRALSGFARPGGLVLAGEPYWRRPPDPAYLDAERMRADRFSTHEGNVAVGIELGLTPLYVIAGSEDDWDRYESLQWQAAERFAAEHRDIAPRPLVRGVCTRTGTRSRDQGASLCDGVRGWRCVQVAIPDVPAVVSPDPHPHAWLERQQCQGVVRAYAANGPRVSIQPRGQIGGENRPPRVMHARGPAIHG